MPDTARKPFARHTAAAVSRQSEKRRAVYRRMAWLAAATMLAYLMAHFLVMHAVLGNGPENRLATTMAEAVAIALLPLLILLGYGLRTHAWGLWVLLVLCGGMALYNRIAP